jgi:rhodanese-related sulfurtransferase
MTARWRRWLAGSAALAGILAPFAGSPYRRASVAAVGDAPGAVTGTIDVAELLRIVADQADHVSALELAGWLRAGRPGLRIVDVRSPAEFADYHIPGADNVPIEQLTRARFDPGDTVVLYSEHGIHGAQAWVFLRALGHRRVVFLQNGLREWREDVITAGAATAARWRGWRGC